MQVANLDAVDIVQALFKQRGYTFFASPADYDLNLFGIRRATSSNLFDDLIGCAYRDVVGGPLLLELWAATTDPGAPFLREPLPGTKGTAIVVPKQYRGLWKLGLHKGRPAFEEVGPIDVFRDATRDAILHMDPATAERGNFKINGHDTVTKVTRVDRQSAGCQVWWDPEDHKRALALGRKQVERHPKWDTFTYTLFDARQDPLADALFYAAV